MTARDVLLAPWKPRNATAIEASWGRCTNSRIGPAWDDPKLRHFYRLLNRLTAIVTNKNET